jgi:flagellar biosynthetic protein FliR
MPQVQVFLLAIPVQIMLAIMILSMTLGAMFMYWSREFESAMVFFLSKP